VALFEDSVEILRLSWAGDTFSYRGKHYTLETCRFAHGRIRRRVPPLWFGASVPAAARRAGRARRWVRGDAEHQPRERDGARRHLQGRGGEGRAEGRRDSDARRVGGPHARGGRLVYGPHVMAAYRYYWEARLAEFQNMPPDTSSAWRIWRPIVSSSAIRDVRAGIPALAEGDGREHVPASAAPRHSGGPPHEKIMEAIRLFGERVAAVLPGTLKPAPREPNSGAPPKLTVVATLC